MTRFRITASGRSRIGRPEVVFALCLGLAAPACDAPALGERPAVLELDSDTVRLEAGVTVADVVLRSGGADAVHPDTIRIRVGDVVQFTAADARSHAVEFDRERLTPDAAAFLERTTQLRSPPLLTRGARWIVSFDGAPPGAYPFTDIATGAGGLVTVARAPRPAG
ncbi:MAG TPA: hypothetical protein VF212_10545 [Longimicrobiales bacterium]